MSRCKRAIWWGSSGQVAGWARCNSSPATGGFAVLNNNDLNLGITKALRDAQSYYLLGFDPEDEKFDRKYHSIKLKVKREGLRVRTRSGFIGIADRPKNADLAAEVGGLAVDAPETRSRQILSALFSPFGARDLSMQMTSFFFNSAQAGSFVRSIYNIDVSKLTHSEDPQDKSRRLIKVDIASFTFNESGGIVDQHGRTFTMSLDEAQHRLALQKGMLYTDDFTIKKPGAYQFRTVLRDGATGKLGSAGQFIQVPDLTKKRLALSGLVLSGVGAPGQPADSAGADVNTSPTIRRFSRNGAIDYGLAAYNVVFDSASGKPQLTIRNEIFRDGKSIFQGQPRPVETEGLIDGKVIQCQGRLKLTGFPPGDYVLRVIVNDALAKQKYARAEQWMDFGVR